MRVEFQLSPVRVRELDVLVRALCAINVIYLQEHPEAPRLYQSGVHYKTQPGPGEKFKDIPTVLAAGSGDCDQLAPWRAAELRVRYGVRAYPKCVQISSNLFHVYVIHPNGRAEDVSARLGMRIPDRMVRAGKFLIEKELRRRLAMPRR